MSHSLYAQTLAAADAGFRAGDFEAVLQQALFLLRRFYPMESYLPLGGALPRVDFLLEAVGGKLAGELGGTSRPAAGQDWILATTVYETGGHTPVIADLAAALPQRPAGLVLTLCGESVEAPAAPALERTGFPTESIHCFRGGTLLQTCRDVLRHFQPVWPRRLFLLHHPDDPTAVVTAAALAAAGTEIWLVHHADFSPSAGVFLSGARLIELTPRTCAFSRHVLGLDPIWLPLTCPDPGPAPKKWLQRGHLTTAFCGNAFKVGKASVHGYPEMVASVLRSTGGTHVHWGALADLQHEQIGRALDKAGIAQASFIHFSSTPRLVEGLRAQAVDVLLNSWPLGGARTSVEAMASGVPMVWHSAQPSQDRVYLQMAYEGAAVWRQPADLQRILSDADAPWLEAQSAAARRRYEERHHPSHWRKFFSKPDRESGFPLPKEFDAALFLPAWWDQILEQYLEMDDMRLRTETHAQDFSALQAQIGAMQQRLQKHDRELGRAKEKLQRLAGLKARLDGIESKLGETRYPWPMRLFRRWCKRGRQS